MPKIRIDQLLVQKKLVETRTKAQSYIMAGVVFVNDKKIEKSGTLVPHDAEIHIKVAPYQWVSRGGLKLDHALKHFKISPKDKICMDIGSSTGGFTDVLLYYDAHKVYAIDVGTNQLDWKLRKDKRVVVMEKTNFRYLEKNKISDPIDLIVIDVSFIGLNNILPNAVAFMNEKTEMISLIKPQFEVGKEDVPKGGIIKDSKLHLKAVEKIKTLCKDLNLKVLEVIESPVLGAQGNKEFLIHVKT
ncbi:MAG: TlyA family RNA methyltransferase [Deltaproteobacteria bacterium]|nr:TlyA family RNA methyltransferase [Deltaproteobacteria bacterium]